MRKYFVIFISLIFVPLLSHAQINSATVMSLINTERAKAGLGAVVENAKLDQAAQLKAADMIAKQYFEHIGPDGRDPWSWYAQVGYGWSWAGEILALNSNTESETAIVEAWMNSPGHRAIILDSRYTEVGIGIAVGVYEGQRVVFAVGEFGVPKTPIEPVVIPISVPTPAPVTQPIPVTMTVPVNTASVNTAPVNAVSVKSVVKAVTKPVTAVVKKAEAKEVAKPATTTAAAITSTSTQVGVSMPAQHSWLARLRNWVKSLVSWA